MRGSGVAILTEPDTAEATCFAPGKCAAVPVNPWAQTRRIRCGDTGAKRSAMADIDERFAAYVRDHGEHHLRVAVLLTGDWHAAEDLVQASMVRLYRAWPKLRLDADPDAYLRRLMVK